MILFSVVPNLFVMWPLKTKHCLLVNSQVCSVDLASCEQFIQSMFCLIVVFLCDHFIWWNFRGLGGLKMSSAPKRRCLQPPIFNLDLYHLGIPWGNGYTTDNVIRSWTEFSKIHGNLFIRLGCVLDEKMRFWHEGSIKKCNLKNHECSVNIMTWRPVCSSK